MFVHPLGLLALLAVPAVVALHLFRRRFEPLRISALFLWGAEQGAPLAGRRREPLRCSASLWCELGAALLLALAFAGPRVACAGAGGEHLVVVLDSSASMGAVADGASTRERVLELVQSRVAALGRGSRVTLVESGARPSLLAGPAAFPAEARARLLAWEPRAPRHDLASAVALALQLAGDARVTLVSDHFEPERWPATVELVSLGRPLDNWALTHAARTRERDADGAERERAFVTLASYAHAARELELVVTEAGRELARERRRLEPGARAHLAFLLPEPCGPVEVRLAAGADPADGLALDDAVLLAPPPPRTLGLFSDLEESELRALGLAGAGGFERWLALVPRSVAAPSAETAHLVLARAPAASPAAWTLVLPELGRARRDLLGPFLADRASPVLAGTTFEGVVWSVDPDLALPGVPLVAAGNDPLLSEQRHGERRTWHLALDPARSSLQRSPDWPILLVNLAEARRAALPGAERTNLAVGERFVYRPGAELAGVDRSQPVRYVLEGPLGPDSARSEVPALEQVVIDGLARPGAYRLSFADAPVADFAVSFTDAAESDLRAARPGRRDSSLESARVEGEISWLVLGLLGAALALALLDWTVLERLAGRVARI